MSFRPVLGRSSTVASRHTRTLDLSRSIRMLTTARPPTSSTRAISPTSTPATLTVCPWPGVTACAVVKAALNSKKSLPNTGTQAGAVSRCLDRM